MTSRVLFLSAVRHARDYAALLRTLPEVELFGCSEEETAPAWALDDCAAFASDFDIPVLTFERGLGECDLVVVCSEPTRHARLSVKAIDAGRHTICDKPPGVSLSECRLVAEHLARAPADLRFSTVHRLFSPEILRARRLIDQGAIGLPLMLDAELIVSGGLDGSTVERHELVCDPALSGGGELLNFGWYPVSAVRFLTGLEAIDVQAFGGALFDDRYANHGVEDSVVASLRLANAVTATLMVARIPAIPGGLPASSTMRVIGSHGRLIADEDAPSSFVAETGQASARVHRFGRESSSAALQGFFEDFLAAVRDGRPPTMEISDILANMATLDAIAGSLSSGLCERVVGA